MFFQGLDEAGRGTGRDKMGGKAAVIFGGNRGLCRVMEKDKGFKRCDDIGCSRVGRDGTDRTVAPVMVRTECVQRFAAEGDDEQ